MQSVHAAPADVHLAQEQIGEHAQPEGGRHNHNPGDSGSRVAMGPKQDPPMTASSSSVMRAIASASGGPLRSCVGFGLPVSLFFVIPGYSFGAENSRLTYSKVYPATRLNGVRS